MIQVETNASEYLGAAKPGTHPERKILVLCNLDSVILANFSDKLTGRAGELETKMQSKCVMMQDQVCRTQGPVIDNRQGLRFCGSNVSHFVALNPPSIWDPWKHSSVSSSRKMEIIGYYLLKEFEMAVLLVVPLDEAALRSSAPRWCWSKQPISGVRKAIETVSF